MEDGSSDDPYEEIDIEITGGNPPPSRGGRWRGSLQAAFEAAWDKDMRSGKGGEPQFFELDSVHIWGNNPIREYKIVLKATDDPGSGP
jgi:hypothetical protein